MRFARLTFAAAVWLAAVGAAPPKRIVSLNPCIDSVVMRIVEPSRIVGISHYSLDPDGSLDAALARRFPVAGETAEEIAQLKPDMVLTTRHMSLATRRVLVRLKVPLVELDPPESVAESHAQIRLLARLTARTAAGEALIGEVDRAIDRARPAAGTPPLSAMIIHSSGYSPGAGTLLDELLRRTGFENRAAAIGTGWGKITLEQLMAKPPALLIASVSRNGAARDLQHPVLQATHAPFRQVELPSKLLYCGGPHISRTVEALAAVRRSQAK